MRFGLVLLCSAVVLIGCTGNSSRDSVPSPPIATEPVPTSDTGSVAASPNSAVASSAVELSTLAQDEPNTAAGAAPIVPDSSISVATSVVPEPTPLTYRQPVLIRFEPKTDDERMLIEVAKELIPKKVLIDNRLETDPTILGEVYTPNAAREVSAINERDSGSFIVPGPSDRTVLLSASKNGQIAVLELCDANDASTYVRDNGRDPVLSGVAGVPESYLDIWSLKLSDTGWRIAATETTAHFVGEDRCAH